MIILRFVSIQYRSDVVDHNDIRVQERIVTMSNVERLGIAQIENSPNEIKPLLREGTLDLIKDVIVKLEVRVGASEMTINEFMNLGQGSVVQMAHPTTEPVDLLIDGRIGTPYFIQISIRFGHWNHVSRGFGHVVSYRNGNRQRIVNKKIFTAKRINTFRKRWSGDRYGDEASFA